MVTKSHVHALLKFYTCRMCEFFCEEQHCYIIRAHKKYHAVVRVKYSRFSWRGKQIFILTYPMGKGSVKSSQTKLIKEQTKTCPGQAKFENFLSKEQSAIQVCFEPWS